MVFDERVRDSLASPEHTQADNSQLLARAREVLSPEDYLFFDDMVGNPEGKTDHLYDVSDKAMHTTNDFYFDSIL